MPDRRRWEAGNTYVPAAIMGAAVLMVARVASAAPVSIWYRTTDGCPSAEAFIERVSQQGVEARVARVGDHIDFVVTLGREEAQASATLER